MRYSFSDCLCLSLSLTMIGIIIITSLPFYEALEPLDPQTFLLMFANGGGLSCKYAIIHTNLRNPSSSEKYNRYNTCICTLRSAYMKRYCGWKVIIVVVEPERLCLLKMSIIIKSKLSYAFQVPKYGIL